MAAASKFSYEEVAARLNQFLPELDVRGLILQADEAVLVENRLTKAMPIVDEVRHISRIPEGKDGGHRGGAAGKQHSDAVQSIRDRNAF